MRLLLLILLLLPFLINIWNGYLKPAQSGKFKEINCSEISNSLNPYVNDIVHIAQQHGNKSSSSMVEGYKITRSTIRVKLPQVFNIIEEYVSSMKNKKVKPADCEKEQYCWFLRLYNQSGHYIDWHFDNNFTSGLRKTYVCNIYTSECNASHLMTKDRNGRVKINESVAGKGVLYNGSDVKHSVSKQMNGCTRISLIIPLYENDSVTMFGWFRRLARNVSDKVFKL